jgi:hypothetical protein
MAKYIVCPSGDLPNDYDEIEAFDIEDAVKEYAEEEYNEEHFEEIELNVYTPDNLETPIGTYSVIVDYKPVFRAYEKKKEEV